MKLAATQQLYSYWRDLKGERGAPERNDIDPGVIRGVLADTFILDFDPKAGFPIRIVGTRTNALFQRELRNQPFLELWKRADRAEVSSIIGALADDTQPFLLGASGGPCGDEAINIEVLLLPLRRQGATHARLLGACAPHRTPAWFGLLPISALSLTSLRALHDGEREAGESPGLRRASGAPDTKRRGHLLVYSNAR